MSLLTPHMTQPQGARAAQEALTCPGMAHFAGTGPDDETCRTCLHWGRDRKRVRRSADGELRRSLCWRFSDLSSGDRGGPVDHWRPACRHWIGRPNPPVAVRKPRSPACRLA